VKVKAWDTNVNLIVLGSQRGEDPQKYVDKLKEAGFGACIRYFRRTPRQSSALWREEVDLYHRNNIRVGAVFQHRSNDVSLFNAENGTIDGKAAILCADAVGMPQSKPIHFAFDTDFTTAPDHQRRIVDYLSNAGRPVKTSGRIVAVYGDSEVLKFALDTPHPEAGMGDLADMGWLTNAKAWSGDKRIFQLDHPKVHARQVSLPGLPYSGAPFQVDVCEIDDILVDVVTW
jgi:hypothetical protein